MPVAASDAVRGGTVQQAAVLSAFNQSSAVTAACLGRCHTPAHVTVQHLLTQAIGCAPATERGIAADCRNTGGRVRHQAGFL